MLPLRRVLKDSFIAGLLVAGPFLVTVFVFNLAFEWTLAVVDPLVRGTGLAAYTGNFELLAQALTLALLVATITAVGLLAQVGVGRRTLGGLGQFVNLIPLFRTVYRSIRQVADGLVQRSSQYESVVYVEHPRDGIYTVGFVTAESPPDVHEIAGQDVYNVYLPSSPNPTGGGLRLVPEDRMYESDLSVRQGIRLLMTTGVSSEPEADLPPGLTLPAEGST
jgi:uncharacterized membrane protein